MSLCAMGMYVCMYVHVCGFCAFISLIFIFLLLFSHFVPILYNRHEKISDLEVRLEEEQERVNNGDLCVL